MPTSALPEVQYLFMRSSWSPSSFSRRVNRTATSHLSRFSRPGKSLSDLAMAQVETTLCFDSRYFCKIGSVLSDSYSVEPEMKQTRNGLSFSPAEAAVNARPMTVVNSNRVNVLMANPVTDVGGQKRFYHKANLARDKRGLIVG